jgi:TaqI-like C-terminal specificity domain
MSDYLQVFQGYVSGADDIFITPKADVPGGEEAIYLDYMPDKKIGRYRIPNRADEVVFYPYDGFTALTETSLSQNFRKTWRYLERNRGRLELRGPVQAGKTPWWRPERPRDPDRMKRPKIIGPHLTLTPRFAIDSKGNFAVSRSPFLIAREMGDELTLLRFFCAILNSSVSSWYIRTYAPKYAHGYNRVEANLLKAFPAPDMSKVDAAEINRIASAVERLQAGRGAQSLDYEIDSSVADLYGFSSSERRNILGIE